MDKSKTARALRMQIRALVTLTDPLSIKAAEDEIERLIGLLEQEDPETPFATKVAAK